MQLTAWVTLAALTMYVWIFTNVGRARGTYKIKAPSTEGPVEFQSIVRVQINTVEQMIWFLPSLWMCAYFYNDGKAAAVGALWVVGRIVYALGYYKAPGKRSLGFGIAGSANIVLMIGTAIGLLTH